MKGSCLAPTFKNELTQKAVQSHSVLFNITATHFQSFSISVTVYFIVVFQYYCVFSLFIVPVLYSFIVLISVLAVILSSVVNGFLLLCSK